MFHYCLRFSLSPGDMVEIKVVETQMVSRARRGTHSVWSEHTDRVETLLICHKTPLGGRRLETKEYEAENRLFLRTNRRQQECKKVNRKSG